MDYEQTRTKSHDSDGPPQGRVLDKWESHEIHALMAKKADLKVRSILTSNALLIGNPVALIEVAI